jgi:mannose-6-phosphate isomerase-like protein (cupin superfamily)
MSSSPNLADLAMAEPFTPADHSNVTSRYLVQGENLILQECVMAAGGRAAAHVHDDKDQVFLVLDGALRVRSGAESEVVVGADQSLHIPAGCRHAADNPGQRPCRYFVITYPAAE